MAKSTSDQEKNTLGMSPSLRPEPPRYRANLKREPTRKEKELEQYYSQSRTRLYHQEQNMQSWRRPSRDSKRLQRILAKDPRVRAAVFDYLKQNNLSMADMSPQQMLTLARSAQKQLDQMAKLQQQQMAQLRNAEQVDPTDPTHPFNQANPNNLTNQYFAIQNAIVIEENVDDARNLMNDTMLQEENQGQDNELTEENETKDNLKHSEKPTFANSGEAKAAEEIVQEKALEATLQGGKAEAAFVEEMPAKITAAKETGMAATLLEKTAEVGAGSSMLPQLTK